MNILITGGASGLGEAITRRLAANAANKVYFTFSKSAQKAQLLTEEFKNTESIPCDFRSPADMERLLKQIEGLGLQALINNAYTGQFTASHFHKTSPDHFVEEFNSNILPVISITQAAIHSFRKNKNGRIITVLTSALLHNPPVGASAYMANKAYLQQLVKVWATENIKFNIVSNSVSPAFMQTEIHREMDERLIEQLRENHPLKKLLSPEEAAAPFEFLLTAPLYINGIDIPVNAGTSIR